MWMALLFAVLIGLASGFIWAGVIHHVRSIQNSMFTNLAFVFILYGAVEMMGFNGGISVLSFGILLGNAGMIRSIPWVSRSSLYQPSGFTSSEKDFFAEMVFIVQTYFFVYVGLSIQFGSSLVLTTALVLILLILMLRVPASLLLISRRGLQPPDRSIMAVMTPKGMVPAVLASIPLQRGFPQGQVIQDLGYSVVFFSILICSLLVILLYRKPLPPKPSAALEEVREQFDEPEDTAPGDKDGPAEAQQA
ncbi:MAG TPA: cation:proton antiporter, partial [Bacteroidales bacterium]|nr:cation:proton antiporter [Bacteroidales bacterium]